jgi:hypothetical protein
MLKFLCSNFYAQNWTGDHTPVSVLTSVPKSTSWYGRLSDEKKLEYLDKQRKSRQKKKDELQGATLLSYYLQPQFINLSIYLFI